ncbi:unnamed protein product, partial [Prorocentrum cordatum]
MASSRSLFCLRRWTDRRLPSPARGREQLPDSALGQLAGLLARECAEGRWGDALVVSSALATAVATGGGELGGGAAGAAPLEEHLAGVLLAVAGAFAAEAAEAPQLPALATTFCSTLQLLLPNLGAALADRLLDAAGLLPGLLSAATAARAPRGAPGGDRRPFLQLQACRAFGEVLAAVLEDASPGVRARCEGALLSPACEPGASRLVELLVSGRPDPKHHEVLLELLWRGLRRADDPAGGAPALSLLSGAVGAGPCCKLQKVSAQQLIDWGSDMALQLSRRGHEVMPLPECALAWGGLAAAGCVVTFTAYGLSVDGGEVSLEVPWAWVAEPLAAVERGMPLCLRVDAAELLELGTLTADIAELVGQPAVEMRLSSGAEEAAVAEALAGVLRLLAEGQADGSPPSSAGLEGSQQAGPTGGSAGEAAGEARTEPEAAAGDDSAPQERCPAKRPAAGPAAAGDDDQAAAKRPRQGESEGDLGRPLPEGAPRAHEAGLPAELLTATWKQLSAACRQLGLPAGGRKQQLLERLQQHHQEAAPAAAPAPAAAGGDGLAGVDATGASVPAAAAGLVTLAATAGTGLVTPTPTAGTGIATPLVAAAPPASSPRAPEPEEAPPGAGQGAEEAAEGPQDEGDEENRAMRRGLSAMSVPDLRKALCDLSLPCDGRKADMVARLVMYADSLQTPVDTLGDSLGIFADSARQQSPSPQRALGNGSRAGSPGVAAPSEAPASEESPTPSVRAPAPAAEADVDEARSGASPSPSGHPPSSPAAAVEADAPSGRAGGESPRVAPGGATGAEGLVEDLSTLPVRELRKACREHGLASGGTKHDLVERLMELVVDQQGLQAAGQQPASAADPEQALSAPSPPGAGRGGPPAAAGGAAAPEPAPLSPIGDPAKANEILAIVARDLRAMPLRDLRAACRRHQLPAEGSKSELVALLAELAVPSSQVGGPAAAEAAAASQSQGAGSAAAGPGAAPQSSQTELSLQALQAACAACGLPLEGDEAALAERLAVAASSQSQESDAPTSGTASHLEPLAPPAARWRTQESSPGPSPRRSAEPPLEPSSPLPSLELPAEPRAEPPPEPLRAPEGSPAAAEAASAGPSAARLAPGSSPEGPSPAGTSPRRAPAGWGAAVAAEAADVPHADAAAPREHTPLSDSIPAAQATPPSPRGEDTSATRGVAAGHAAALEAASPAQLTPR